jgi:uncharacterized protein (TIGR03067 family)
LTEILDGTANTLLVVEAAEPTIWTKPDDLPFDQKKPLPKLGIYERATHVAMCDGKILALAPNTPEDTIRALATRNGGEMVSAPVLVPEPPQAIPLYLELRRKRSDRAALDGRWLLESAEYQGKAATEKGMFPEELLFKGDRYGITWSGKQHEGQMKVDPAKSPSEIDFSGSIFDGPRPRRIIYRLEGDRLTLCLPFVGPKSDPERPTEFKSGPESKNAVLVYRRAAADAPPILPATPKPPAPPDPAVVEPLRELVAAAGRNRDLVKARFEAGTSSRIDLLKADAELVEARIRLAEAEGNRDDVVALHEVLVAHRKDERDLIAIRVEAGADAVDALNKADARLADARVRLAKVKPPAPAAPAPRPKK